MPKPEGLVRVRRALLFVVVSVIALALTACGDSGPKQFEDDGYPFTFEYPEDFQTGSEVTFDDQLGAAADDSTGFGIDDSNLIAVQRVTLNLEIDAGNIDRAKAEFDRLLAEIDPSASAEIAETAGFPSLSYDSLPIPEIEDAESRLTILFEGDQEYVINCQSTPAERETITEACDQALETLTAT